MIMDILQSKLCDIQGRLFEMSADKEYDSVTFIKQFMNPGNKLSNSRKQPT